MGFDALGHLHPFLDEPRSQPYKGTYASMILEAVDRVGKIRATAGGNVDLCLELQRRMKRGEAIALAHAVEKYNPMSWRISPLRGHVKLELWLRGCLGIEGRDVLPAIPRVWGA